MPTTSKLIEQVEKALAAGEAEQSKIPPDVLALHGYSSPKIRHFFKVLCVFPVWRYLEGGCFLGATTIAAAYDNPGTFDCMDDYSYREDVSKARKRLPANLEAFKEHAKIRFYEGDLWQTLRNKMGLNGVNVWFYDAGHTEAETAYAFWTVVMTLQRASVIIIDDYRWPRVQRGVTAGIAIGSWDVVREWEKTSPGIKHGGRENWWNGLWIGVVDGHQ